MNREAKPVSPGVGGVAAAMVLGVNVFYELYRYLRNAASLLGLRMIARFFCLTLQVVLWTLPPVLLAVYFLRAPKSRGCGIAGCVGCAVLAALAPTTADVWLSGAFSVPLAASFDLSAGILLLVQLLLFLLAGLTIAGRRNAAAEGLVLSTAVVLFLLIASWMETYSALRLFVALFTTMAPYLAIFCYFLGLYLAGRSRPRHAAGDVPAPGDAGEGSSLPSDVGEGLSVPGDGEGASASPAPPSPDGEPDRE